jgi:hypothetical protein
MEREIRQKFFFLDSKKQNDINEKGGKIDEMT